MEVGEDMITSKEKLLKLINEFPESELNRVLEFVENLNNRSYDQLAKPYESSLDFWDEAIDNEIWNNI
ncbi:MAG TPA: DUF2281 domain-containing protein [Bacillus bacterium]|nr:DUF2281 domain-containing protein [Bacillus sp. (in: firmicutes)]